MAHTTTASTVERTPDDAPAVRRIDVTDLQRALWKGVDDFQAKPSHILFLGIIYPIVALFFSRLTFGYDVLPLLFPLVAGFALIGPVGAIGLYELSRRREQGLDVEWRHAFGVLKSPSIGAIAALGALLAVIFLAWLGVAMAIFEATLGTYPSGVLEFLDRLFTTSEGWIMIVAGNGVGFLFALFVLMISAVSFPMLIDRRVSAFTAMHTSVRAFLKNPRTMTTWGFVVALSLVLGCIPLFVGLAVVVPVLGHATWHLYRRVVER